MSQSTPGLIKNYSAEGAVAKFRIVKFGAADGGVLQATASTEALIGVNDRIAAAVSGDRIDVVRNGLTPVEYGGTVAAGDWLTSDASGRAVAAAPGAGVNANVIGRAEIAGVVGDIGSVVVQLGRIQG